jgi:hypothetical protein
VFEQRGAEISKLQQGRKYHDRHYRLRQCGALRIGKCRKAGRAENNDRGRTKNLNRIPSIDPINVLQMPP